MTFCWNLLACWHNSAKIAKFQYILSHFLTSGSTIKSEKSLIFRYFTKIWQLLVLASMKWPKLAIFHFSPWVIFILYENTLILGVSVEKVHQKWDEMEKNQKNWASFMLKFDLQLKICQTTHFDKVNYICFKNLDNNAFQRFMPKICPNMPNMPKISSIMDRTIFKIIKVQILDI